MDAATNQVDVRVQASGGSVGSNFTSYLSFYGSNFSFNGGVNNLTNSITCSGLTNNHTSLWEYQNDNSYIQCEYSSL